MSGFRMLNIDRIKGELCVGLSEQVKTFDPVAVLLWLRTVQDFYRNDGCKMSFDEPTRLFLIDAGAGAMDSITAMSEPGRLLLEVVGKALSMPARDDFDENLELIAQVLARAKTLQAHKGKLKLVYTVRRPPGDGLTLIVSLRSDVYGSFGLEAGLLVTNALLAALKRERQRGVYLLNPPVPEGFDRSALRPGPRYDNWLDGDALRIFIDHVLKLNTEEIKANLKLIKAVRDHYRQFELPEPIDQQ